MNERIESIKNLLRILAKNHEIVIKSELPTKETIDVVDFIRQFSANLQNELAMLNQTKQDEVKALDAEVVSSPSIGSDSKVTEISAV